MSGTPLTGSSVAGTSAGVVDGTIDEVAETADSSPAHAATSKANAATAERLCRTKTSVTTPSPNRTALPEPSPQPGEPSGAETQTRPRRHKWAGWGWFRDNVGVIRTRLCEVLGIEHPVALGGMPTVYNTPTLTAAVSEAGGIGIMGCTSLDPGEIGDVASEVRDRTERPFGLNALLFLEDKAGYAAMLAAAPGLISLSWPRKDQDVGAWVEEAHDVGSKVSFMAADVEDAVRGAEAGADVIVAQGTEGGGHVGWMGLSVLLPMVVDAVTPVPVVAAGGIADGRGLAAALAYGADGVLLGTRFLATDESGLHPNHKQAIVHSDGHDTVLTEIPDIISGTVWPGAMSRVKRNRLIDRWAGQEWGLRQNLAEAAEGAQDARRAGDPEEAPLFFGQDAGLIDDLPRAADIVVRIVTEAEEIINHHLPPLAADE